MNTPRYTITLLAALLALGVSLGLRPQAHAQGKPAPAQGLVLAKEEAPIVCKLVIGPPGPERDHCAKYCQAQPATPTCLIALRFGAAGTRAFFEYQRQVMSAALPPDARRLAKKQQLSGADAADFELYLRGSGIIKDTINDPILKPHRLGVLQNVSRRCAMMGQELPVDDKIACEAEQLGLEEEIFGARSLMTIQTRARIAEQLAAAQRYRETYPYYERAVALLWAHQPEHPWALTLLTSWAEHAYSAHDYELALKLNTRALIPSKRIFGPFHPTVAALADQRGRIYTMMHDYGEARQWVEHARDARVAVQGVLHIDTGLAYYSYGKLLIRLNDKPAAFEAYRAAIMIFAKLEPQGILHGVALHDLAMVLARFGRYEDAQEAFLKAKAIFDARQDTPVTMVQTLLSNLGEVAMYLGHYEEASARFEQSAKALRKVFGDKPSPELARHHQNLSRLAQAQGLIAQAAAERKLALALYEQVLAPTNPDLLAMRAAVAYDLLASGERADAITLHRATLKAALRYALLNSGSVWNNTQRLSFVAQMGAQLDVALGLLPDDEAFEASLRWQGLATAQEQRASDVAFVRSTLPKEAHVGLDAYLRFEHAPPKAPDKLKTFLALKAALTQGSAAFAALTAAPAPTISATCQALQTQGQDALISYLSHSPPQSSTTTPGVAAAQGPAPHLLAFVLRRSNETSDQPARCALTRVELGPAAPIEQAIAQWRQATERAEACYQKRAQASLCTRELTKMDEASTQLYTLTWAPLVPALGADAKRAVIVPDMGLNQVPFAALMTPKRRYLIEQLTLTTLTHAAALLRPQLSSKLGANALVFGDIDYEHATTSVKQALSAWERCDAKGCGAVNDQTAPAPLIAGAALKGAGAVCGYRSAWAPLQTEALAVSQRLAARYPQGVYLARAQAATATSLLGQLQDAHTVHLATHGFFAPAKTCGQYALKPSQALLNLWDLARPLEDPLLLSALVFAGANADARATTSQAPQPAGIISARQIAQLNLRATALVVLSACETGLGQLIPGEGALGLARAFAIAGARHTLVSMWKIPSAPTTALFESFYAQKRLDAEALRQAQLVQLERLRSQGLKHASLLWGAFVMVDG